MAGPLHKPRRERRPRLRFDVLPAEVGPLVLSFLRWPREGGDDLKDFGVEADSWRSRKGPLSSAFRTHLAPGRLPTGPVRKISSETKSDVTSRPCVGPAWLNFMLKTGNRMEQGRTKINEERRKGVRERECVRGLAGPC